MSKFKVGDTVLVESSALELLPVGAQGQMKWVIEAINLNQDIFIISPIENPDVSCCATSAMLIPSLENNYLENAIEEHSTRKGIHKV